jgi:squalene-hopene/tetraprenyl-beta-curcumene cyclase
MSSWTRTIVVPLAIVSACRPVKQLPDEKGIRELFLEDPLQPRWPAPPTKRWLSWTNFFLGVDASYKRLEPVLKVTGVRRKGLESSLAWMRERFQESDGLGAIFPPMIYTILALDCLGVPRDSDEVAWAHKQLEDLKVRDGECTWLQPCVSPVWDTALSLNALAEAGLGARDQAVEAAGEWLLGREVRRKGDWADRVEGCEPGGWVFEYNNAFYPDTDDTAMVLMALTRTGLAAKPHYRPAVRRALDWLIAMQDDNGGWAAFDRGINREFLEKVPFADHNAMLDPCCPDITARVLEALAPHGMVQGDPLADKAIAFLRSHQESFGAWIGRWGVNYIYGTWQVLAGLHACGVSPNDPMVRRAADWLESVQQESGAWGEGCESYEDKTRAGVGTATASQTAWALLGLVFAGRAKSEAARAGARWLAETQVNGTWNEEPFTGTGFPKVFYLKYHYYRHYFPLMALGRWLKAVQADQ